MPPEQPSPDRPWPPPARMAASLLVAAYLAAVLLPPLAGPQPASELAGVAIQPFRPLIGGLYLGHGYRFFAPNPGPGHSIRWTMRMPDGSERAGSIPDEATDRPRLLYHRRFMIAEKIAALVPMADAPDAIRMEARREWLPLVQGIAGHLLETHGGTRVDLRMIEHELPSPEDLEEARRVQAADAGQGGDTRERGDVVTPLGVYERRTNGASRGDDR